MPRKQTPFIHHHPVNKSPNSPLSEYFSNKAGCCNSFLIQLFVTVREWENLCGTYRVSLFPRASSSSASWPSHSVIYGLIPPSSSAILVGHSTANCRAGPLSNTSSNLRWKPGHKKFYIWPQQSQVGVWLVGSQGTGGRSTFSPWVLLCIPQPLSSTPVCSKIFSQTARLHMLLRY